MKKYFLLPVFLSIVSALPAQDESIKTFSGHDGSVYSVSYSPDGKYLASGSYKEIKIWDVNTGNCLKTFKGYNNYVESVSYSPDGKYLASGSYNNIIKIWDVNTGNCIKTFYGHNNHVYSVSYSLDGKYLASGSGDNTIKIWEVNTGKCLRTLKGHNDYVRSVSYSPDGKYLASGSLDNTIKIWDVNRGNCIKTFSGHTSSVFSVSYSPDGKYLASGSWDNTIKIWDVNTGNCLKTFSGHNWLVYSVSYSPDGKYLASGSADNTIKIWDVNTGNCIKTFSGHNGGVLSVSYSPDGKYLASSSSDNTIKIWDLSSFTVPKEFPQLTITGINFSDKNNNNRIDGAEDCDLTFTINNTGKGAAQNVIAKVKNNSTVTGLSFKNTVTIGNIESGSYKQVKIPISGTMLLTSGTAEINVSFTEQFGFQPDDFNLQIETKEFLKPLVKVSDYEFYTTDGTIRLGLPVNLICLVQNIGQGIAEDVNVEFQLPSINIFPVSNTSFNIGKLEPGQQRELNFEFIANKLYTGTTVPVTVKITEKYGKYSESFTANATVNATSSTPTTIAIRSNVKDEKPANIQIASLKSDVDKTIPQNPEKKPNRYALIIGNEDYQSHQTGLNVESNVEFAKNDALIFKEYVKNTLGVKEENIYCLTDATTGAMWQYIELVSKIVSKTPNAELIFYYAGHGYPDENTKDPYLIPVDVNATNISLAIKLSDVYKKFSETGAKRITIFLDACFSGGAREMGLIAGRNVKIVPKAEALSGNMIVFAASSGEQSALPYKEVKHGMFTYFLLKKLQETKGNITYKELADYLTQNVSIESLKVNQKDQDPKVNYSKDIEGVWEGWTVR